MKPMTQTPQNQKDYDGLSPSELLAVIAEQQRYIERLEEYLRLANIRRYAAKSEKLAFQADLFDEAELETALDDLAKALPDEESVTPKRAKRRRGFSPKLQRIRVEHRLSDDEKAGASRTFFTKVKEELDYIPARLNVIEHWQEKAVFETETGEESLIAAKRPLHVLGKCSVSHALLAAILVGKYADGLPLYRLENQFKRLGHYLDRTNMAHWIVQLHELFQPLITLIRETQNDYDYLNMDETRIQVLKEDGKSAQSDKWMWVTCGGPPDRPSILFEYDPSRSGRIPERLLQGFTGILQVDGYAGYNKNCKSEGVRRIGCWDHARRKFVEAGQSASTAKEKHNPSPSIADSAIAQIRQLYAIEKNLKDRTPEQKRLARQEYSLPILNTFNIWLEKNQQRVLKGSLTRTAIDYTLNQWPYLTGYCEDGRLNISNARAENAIRPFAVGRRAWLFADTSHGARASATCYSLIETAKANELEPHAYILHVLNHIPTADTLEKLEALLPWNVELSPSIVNPISARTNIG